jgi:hypothetical protein
MYVDFPKFIEDLVEEGAVAEGTDALNYLSSLVIEDSNRREEARRNTPRLPEVPPGARERALKKVLKLRSERLRRERIIPLAGRKRY